MGGRDGEVGFVLADEAFQGSCPHMVVRPTALCQPEKLNGCCHTAGLTTHPVSQRDPAPLAPLDPASGSRTGGALRGGGWGAMESAGSICRECPTHVRLFGIKS